MRVSRIILFIFTLSIFMSGCKTISVLPYDEMIYKSWEVKNTNEITAELRFDTEKQYAYLDIFDAEEKACSIYGTYSVDSKSLCIFSRELMREFRFEYNVYNNRLELRYNENTIVMYIKK